MSSMQLSTTVFGATLAGMMLSAPSTPAKVRQPGPADQRTHATSDSADAVAAVTGFHAALARGESGAALALLAPDVVIIEADGTETLAEYRLHHLPADIAYARAIASVNTLRSVAVRGDVAWVTTTSSKD